PLGGSVVVEILFPDREMTGANPNDASVVAKVIYTNTSFLLTGDAPKKIENYLVRSFGDALQATVLKAGHHGSHTSSGELFIGTVAPLFAVVSAGRDNRYGHPHKEVVDRFLQFSIPFLRTDEKGAVIFKSNGESVSVH
ncbi:MAG: hypothetical protein WD003_02765, partial [Candidatus Paceibacterota bacterium]